MKSIPLTTFRILACTWAVPSQLAVSETLQSGVRAGAMPRDAIPRFEVERRTIEH